MKSRSQKVDPTHWVYLLLHVIFFVSGLLLVRGNDDVISISIGTSLIATAITGWTIFIYIFLTREMADRIRTLTEFGVLAAFDARSVRIREEYDKRLLTTKERIDIMGFGLRALREDYADSFRSWGERATVRILVLDPEFPSSASSFADQRDVEELQTVGQIKNDVDQFVQSVRRVMGSTRSVSFQLKFYRCLPSINVFRIDDELFWGPYFIREQSRNAPTILVRRGGLLFDRVTRHFEAIWNDPNFSRFVDDVPSG